MPFELSRRDLAKFQAYLTEQEIDKVEAIDEVTVQAFLAKLSRPPPCGFLDQSCAI